MQFEYFYSSVAANSIDIDDIGNCAIRTFNDVGESWVLLIKTQLGSTQILQYGPFIEDMSTNICTYVKSTYSRFDYDQRKIIGIVDSALNDTRNGISQAIILDYDEAKKFIKNVGDLVIEY